MVPAARAPHPQAANRSARTSSSSSGSTIRMLALRTAQPGRLQVAACHRCLVQPARQRSLIQHHLPKQQQLQHNGRHLSSAAVLKDGQEVQQTGAAAEKVVAQQRQQAADGQQGQQQPAEQQQEQQDSAGVKAALAMLKFYKAAISPLLPPACRFQPTCSGARITAQLAAAPHHTHTCLCSRPPWLVCTFIMPLQEGQQCRMSPDDSPP